MTNYKACYFDLDGTLLNASGEVDKRDIESIERLHDAGILVGIATGRPWFAAKEIALKIRANAPIMTFSGALITDSTGDKTISRFSPHKEDSETVLKQSREKGWYIEVYTEEDYYIEKPTYLTEIHSGYLHQEPKIADLDEIITRDDVLKVVLVFDTPLDDLLLEEIKSLAPNSELGIAYGAGHSDITYVNFTSHDASRDNALKKITELLECSAEELIAFGDGESDIPFLRSVGTGVAMGNANSAVKEAARHITSSVEEQGVSVFLSDILPG